MQGEGGREPENCVYKAYKIHVSGPRVSKLWV